MTYYKYWGSTGYWGGHSYSGYSNHYYSGCYNNSPVITNVPSDGTFCIDENTSFVVNLDSYDKDGDSVTYKIAGGADKDLFEIDPRTGELTLKDAPDYENPASADGDNTYHVTVKVSDGKGGDSVKDLKVVVKDVEEATTPECIVIEAEDFYSCGFQTVCSSTGSGGEIVRLKSCDGFLSTDFDGETGTYNLSIFAQDENDGVSKLMIYVGGELVDTVMLDRNSDGGGNDNGMFSQFDLGEIQVANGEEIRIEAWKNCGEYVRIDKICLEPVEVEPGCEPVVIAAEDFEGGASGWSNNTTDYDDDFSEFLGRFDRCDNPTKSFDIPADAETVTVAFDLYIIDSWDGEHATVTIDGTTVDLGEFRAGVEVGTRTGTSNGISYTVETTTGPAQLGFWNGECWTEDQILRVTLDVPADKISGDQMTLTFDSTTDSGICDESFGIDNLLITADVPCDVDPVATGVIGGRYFCDTDGDDTEFDGAGGYNVGVVGATVYLIQDGAVVATTTTDGTGTYSFESLVAGDYSVTFQDPEDVAGQAGKEFVAGNVGTTGEDSDVTSIETNGDGSTVSFSLAEGETKWNIDAGIADPATASVGNVVFLDANGNGLFDAGDSLVENAMVELLDSTGTVLSTTFTGTAGDYLFENLKAGSYQVRFTAPDASGLVFTTQSANAADAVNNDSDADALTGLTDTFELSIGEAELDIDAGLVVPNVAPTAADDTGMSCANEELTIDVLANDSDSDGGTVAVSSVAGQAATGSILIDGTAVKTDAAGNTSSFDFTGLAVSVTAAGLVIDAESAFYDLEYGEKAEVTFSYEITDGQGGTASADVDLTVCGVADTLEDLCATLPETVQYEIRDGFSQAGLTDIALDVVFYNTGDARFDGVVFEEAYCLSFFESALGEAEFDGADLLNADLYCADPADLPSPDTVFDGPSGSTLGGLASVNAAENLDFINYILNQDFKGQGYTDYEIQVAIWEFTDSANAALGGQRFTDLLAGTMDSFDLGSGAGAAEIVADALANGDGFVAGEGDVVGLILDPSDLAPASNLQPLIVAVEFNDFDCIC